MQVAMSRDFWKDGGSVKLTFLKQSYATNEPLLHLIKALRVELPLIVMSHYR